MLIIGCDPTWNIPSKGNTGCTSRSWYEDLDRDGFGATTGEVWGCEPPEADGWVKTAGDCDDEYETTYPGAPELCDELDNNCDGDAADLGLVTFYPDEGPPTPIYDGLEGGLAIHDPGTLYLCDGTHVGHVNVYTTERVAIEGKNGFGATTLDAQGLGRVITIMEDSTLFLNGLTIKGGEATYGGGLHCISGEVALNDVMILENNADYGGGLNAEGGCVVSGGAWIANNVATVDGGGVRLDDATLTTDWIILSGNKAFVEGGGMFASNSDITGDSLDASNNESPLAAGLSLSDSTGAVNILSLSGNVAEDDGGGMLLRNSHFDVMQTALASGNSSYNAGGAFLLSETSSLTLTDTSIYENKARQGAGVWINSASSFTWTGGSWSDNDPDDAYHGSMSWTLEGSNGGECSGSVCTIY